MNITKEVAEFAIKTTYDDFDKDTKKWAKRVLLSSVGMTLAGVNTSSGKRVLSYIKKLDAPQESGVFGAGFKTSAGYAAIANGTTSHSTELEDDAPPDLSTDVGYFPAVFAMGDKLHVSGKEIIESLVIAFEIGSKLTAATVANIESRGSMGPYFCTVAAAAASARMLKLNSRKATMAVSLAVSHCNWFLWFQGGSDAHFYEQGIAMRNGIDSAMLAKNGITGKPDVLDVYCRNLIGATDENIIDLKLGKPYRIKDIGIKKYPCCYPMMQYIESVDKLVEKYDIKAEDLQSIQVDVAPVTAMVCRYPHPKDEMEARFSLHHGIACCFLDRRPFLESWTTERARSPEVKKFRDKVKVVVHPEWAVPESPLGVEMPILVKMKDGTEYKAISPKPTDPIIITDDEVMDKYMKCAKTVLSHSRAEQIAETIMSLEKVKDISELMTWLTFPDK
jgi:2-methylcitrate dehydratase PrpD